MNKLRKNISQEEEFKIKLQFNKNGPTFKEIIKESFFKFVINKHLK